MSGVSSLGVHRCSKRRTSFSTTSTMGLNAVMAIFMGRANSRASVSGILEATILGSVSPNISSSTVMTTEAMAAPSGRFSARANSMVAAEEEAILARLLPTRMAESERE